MFCFPCRKEEKDDGRPRTVNIFFGFFLMINFVLGTGFLGIPYAFVHSGLIVGMFTLLLITLMSWMCSIFVLETMARAQAIYDFKNIPQNAINNNINEKPEFYIVISRKFEPSEQCQMFIGKWMKIIYLLLLAAITFFACLAYSTVAGPALAVNLPLNFGGMKECDYSEFSGNVFPGGACGRAYRFCLFLFACIVIPVSLLDLKEQAIIQFILGLMRFVTIGAIVIYSVVHLAQGDVLINCDGKSENSSNISSGSHWDDLYNSTSTIKEIAVDFNFSGWLISIPVFAYAHILHQGIPALTHPIKEKHWLRGYFNLLFLILGVFYMVLGVTVSLWFRGCTSETCTLNWDPYTHKDHSTALRILSYVIILFPSIDVCSAFPLVVHTTVNNIYTVVFGRDTSQDTGFKYCLIQRLMKFIAAILPICIALFVSNLVIVLNYAGIIGFFIAFFFPVVLQLSSQWVCQKTFCYFLDETNNSLHDSSQNSSPVIKEKTPLLLKPNNKTTFKSICEFLFTTKKSVLYKTPYSMFFSYPVVVLVIGFFSTLTLVFTIASLAV